MDFSNVKDWTIPEGDVVKVVDSQDNVLWAKYSYFYVEDISGSDNVLSIKKTYNFDSIPSIEVFKSTDQVNWESMGTTSATAITATIPPNGKLYLKANTHKWAQNINQNNIMTASKEHNVGGNIMSLLFGDNIYPNALYNDSHSTFSGLFINDTKLINSDKLYINIPPQTDSNVGGIYDGLFYRCRNMVTCPNLSHIKYLTYSSFWRTFSGCSSLTTAPELPNTTKAPQGCYSDMFNGCTSLTTAPALPATTLAYYCYSGMFNGCTSLTTAPALPATALAQYCYREMFKGCTNLNKVTTYATNISASDCLNNWLKNTASTGDFYNLGGANYPSGSSGIPDGWTIHTSL